MASGRGLRTARKVERRLMDGNDETVDGLWRSRLVRQGEELEMGTNRSIVPQNPPAVASWMARKRRGWCQRLGGTAHREPIFSPVAASTLSQGSAPDSVLVTALHGVAVVAGIDEDVNDSISFCWDASAAYTIENC
jgi:hypothetical protein